MRTPATVVMQYTDPVTQARMTVCLCNFHDVKARRALKHALHQGNGSTGAPALSSCDACRNEAWARGARHGYNVGWDAGATRDFGPNPWAWEQP